MAKILFVDDAPDSCEPVRRYLEKSGHKAACATDGREALMEVLANTPDLIILDLMMPELDGPSFLEVLRSYLRLQSLPVVVLTALSESPMIARAESLKVNSVLIKGKARLEDVEQAVNEALARAPG